MTLLTGIYSNHRKQRICVIGIVRELTLKTARIYAKFFQLACQNVHGDVK